jgi:hypothetical protein
MTKTVITASILVCSSLFSQTSPRPDSLGAVTVLTDPSGADLFIDSMFVGKSPLQSILIRLGSHHIKAFYPSVFSWNASVTEETLEIVDAGNFTKHLFLGKILKVQTDPPGSTVLYDGKSLGVTPLYFRGDSSGAGNLIIRKSGYDSLSVPSNEIKGGFLRLQLRPVGDSGAVFSSSDLRGPDLVATDHWPTYVSGLAMIVSGVTSAYLRDQANKEFDRYLVSKNPASLSTTNRLDREATISLVISQICFVVLSYLLLSE